MAKNNKDQKDMMINFKVKQQNAMVVTMLSPDTFGKKDHDTCSQSHPHVQTVPATSGTPTKEVWQFHNESFPNNPSTSRFVPPSMEKNRSTPTLPPRQIMFQNIKQLNSAPDVVAQYRNVQPPPQSQNTSLHTQNVQQHPHTPPISNISHPQQPPQQLMHQHPHLIQPHQYHSRPNYYPEEQQNPQYHNPQMNNYSPNQNQFMQNQQNWAPSPPVNQPYPQNNNFPLPSFQAIALPQSFHYPAPVDHVNNSNIEKSNHTQPNHDDDMSIDSGNEPVDNKMAISNLIL